MEQILNKLSEIELTAQRIMEDCDRQKQQLSEEAEQKCKNYDETAGIPDSRADSTDPSATGRRKRFSPGTVTCRYRRYLFFTGCSLRTAALTTFQRIV